MTKKTRTINNRPHSSLVVDGVKNTPATVAIVLSIVFMALGIVLAAALVVPLFTACATYGPGVHNLNGFVLTCS